MRIERSSAPPAGSATFRLPSTALFLGLMPVFSGLARRAELAAVSGAAPALTDLMGGRVDGFFGDVPGLIGFVGEFMCLSGIAHSPIAYLSLPVFVVAGVVGVTLAAAYALPAYQSVFWAPEGAGSVSDHVTDLNLREKGILWVLCALMLWIGLAPAPWVAFLEPSLRGLSR